MKKIILTLSLFFIGICIISAETIDVKFSDCVDGDTAKFIYKNETITARFLAIDTPETKHPTKGVEPYGKEASEYTCKKLKEANKIVLEYDDDSDKKDKYSRHLVWVFVDEELLQKKLVNKGLANVAYLYGDYKYTEELEAAKQIALDNKLGIWSNEEYNTTNNKDISSNTSKSDFTNINYKEIIVLLGIVIILCIFNNKTKRKVKNKAKKKLKKEIIKRLK